MNPFMLSAPERLDVWGTTRDSLPAMSETDQLTQVAKFWAQCPFTNWSLDPEDTKTWLTIWEMIHEGEFCRNAIAIGMEATLRLSGWNPERLKLVMIKNQEDGEEFFALIIDDHHVINYTHGEITKVDDLNGTIDTLYSYKWKSRNYQRT